MQVIPFSSIFFSFLNHCCCYYYCCFLKQTFLSPSHWLPCPAHSLENHVLGCMLLQSIHWEVYQEKEFNVLDSSSVRGWECSCLAKTFHCSRKGSESLPAARNSACCPSLLGSRHSLCTQTEVYSSLLLFLAHRLHPPFSQFLVYRWTQQSWLDEKIEDYNLNRFQLDWNPLHLAQITRWVLPAVVMSDVV